MLEESEENILLEREIIENIREYNAENIND